jgi:hypothetical protein
MSIPGRLGFLASLAAMSASTAWADEAVLEKNDAPKSATTAPSVLATLQSLIDEQLKHPQFAFKVRSYGFGSDADNLAEQHTWAYGGRLGLTFPEWHHLTIGGAAYASIPAGDAESPNRSLLVAPDGERLLAAGESYLNAHYENWNLRLYRQLLDVAYLNDEDTRMIPNVFEAYTLGYTTQQVYAGVGYVSRMKPRFSEEYLSMSQVAGAIGTDTGVTAAGVRWHPNKAIATSALILYNEDVFSLAYLAGEYDIIFSERTDLRVSAQYTAQQSVGEERIGSFDTDTIGVKLALGHRGAVFTLAGTTTDDGAAIRSPFGQRPSYLSSMLFDFDRAGEDAWLAGVSYRLDAFSLPSWSFVLTHAEGDDSRLALTGAELADQSETDLTVDWRPKDGTFKGCWLRLRYAAGSEGAIDLSQWRITFNYEVKPGAAHQ